MVEHPIYAIRAIWITFWTVSRRGNIEEINSFISPLPSQMCAVAGRFKLLEKPVRYRGVQNYSTKVLFHKKKIQQIYFRLIFKLNPINVMNIKMPLKVVAILKVKHNFSRAETEALC